jgi:hypothetical protein
MIKRDNYEQKIIIIIIIIITITVKLCVSP